MLSKDSSNKSNGSLVKLLHDLGLTENESKVYLASLTLGPTTIKSIAKQAGIKRTTAYSVSVSLKEKGLMIIEIKGLKRKYVSQDPRYLEILAEERKTRLQKALPQLSALYNTKGEEGILKYYEGLESIKTVYEELIEDILPTEEYLVIANSDQWLDIDKEYFQDFIQRRSKLNIHIKKLLLDNEQGQYLKKFEKNINATVKLLPKETNLSTNTVITPQRILIHQLTPPMIGIVIENKSVIQLHRELFKIIWNGL